VLLPVTQRDAIYRHGSYGPTTRRGVTGLKVPAGVQCPIDDPAKASSRIPPGRMRPTRGAEADGLERAVTSWSSFGQVELSCLDAHREARHPSSPVGQLSWCATGHGTVK